MNKNGSRLLDNRKQKIIVSITGIFLVLMILVGLTYAYFLTKITGNTNEKSISVSTANLVLEYGENTNVVQGISNAEPGYSVEKIFTATNKGNSTVTYGAALENIINELSRQEDLVYTLTCTSYLKEGFSLSSDGTITGTVDGTCNGVTTEKQFPNTSTMSIMTTNTIDTLHTQAYKLTITYKEIGEDQSEDMNKTFSAKVNIVDLRANADKINPYSANKNALNYQIINSALEGGENRTTYGSEVTTFTSISGENERVLNIAPDDYGTSYYYRGNVLDNYVTFADKTWRIVRINGDGSVRIILDSIVNGIEFNNNADDNAYVGYMYGMTKQTDSSINQCIRLNNEGTAAEMADLPRMDCELYGYKWAETPYDATHINIVNSNAKSTLENWYKVNIVDTNNNAYISDTLFCNDKTLASKEVGDNNTEKGYGNNTTYYASIERLRYSTGTTSITVSKPTFECAKGVNNTYSRFTSNSTETTKGVKVNSDLTYPIGLLTADEVEYAGPSGYLYNSLITSYWWLMTPYISDSEIPLVWTSFKSLSGNFTNFTETLRPSLNLKSSVLISGGNGTKENPYTVKLS